MKSTLEFIFPRLQKTIKLDLRSDNRRIVKTSECLQCFGIKLFSCPASETGSIACSFKGERSADIIMDASEKLCENTDLCTKYLLVNHFFLMIYSG